MGGKRRPFTSTMDQSLYQELKIQAIKEGRTIADILEELVRDYLNSTQNKTE